MNTIDIERAAMAATLGPLGDFVAEHGLATPLAQYTREDVLALINVVVTSYQGHLYAEHERLAAKDQAHFVKQGVDFDANLDDEIPF